MSAPILYGHPFASYFWKVAIAFHERGVAFELRLLSPENPLALEDLRALWPLEKFPVLRAGDLTVIGSSAIIEWVDARGAGERLIPADPDAALRARMLDRIFDDYVMTPMQAVVADRLRPEDHRDPYGVTQAREQLGRAYRWLETQVGDEGWAAGPTFTMADCASAPALFYADWVEPLGAHARLAAYLRRLRRRPSVARVVDEARPYRSFFPLGVPAHAD